MEEDKVDKTDKTDKTGKEDRFYKEDRFDKFYSLLSSALKSIQKLKTKYMTSYGLSSTHTMCLRYLSKSPDGLTRTKLSRLCDVDKAQISRIVNELCSKGYTLENESENANYKKRLKLTPLGWDVADEINGEVGKVLSFVSSGIPAEQIKNFYATLNDICLKLKEAADKG